jgi:hypothetical protein
MVLAERADAGDTALYLGFGRGKQVQRLKKNREVACRPAGLRAGKVRNLANRTSHPRRLDFCPVPCTLPP